VDFRVRNTRKPECAILYNLTSIADWADDILFLEFFRKVGAVRKFMETLGQFFSLSD
jgi:hypothetical protein